MKRHSFLTASAAGIAAVATGGTQSLAADFGRRAGRTSLVLVGGVNRGAYQAGAIAAFVERAGLRDGEPLDYDMICGTSIGALNSYFVATAQYSLLKNLWLGGVSGRNVFRPKPPFDKIKNVDSGVLTRLAAALKLGTGLDKDVMGILDPQPVIDMLQQYIDPAVPVHIPQYIATTNLTRQTGEIFMRRATSTEGAKKQAVNDAILVDFPIKAVAATDDILRKVLFATACLPLAFEPVEIPRADGSGSDQFCDGGVTANAPINMAQLCTQIVRVIMVDPKKPVPDERYRNAFEIGFGVFQTMQSRMLFHQIVLAYAAGQGQLPFDPYLLRPESELPGKLGDFNDQQSLSQMWQIGYEDGRRGWGEKFTFPLGAGMLSPFEHS